MSRFRVYLKPFDETGVYQSDYTEITDYVDFNNFGPLNQQLDQNNFNVGLFNFSDINIHLRNESGLFNKAGDASSIFQYKRSNSLVKITYKFKDYFPYCGVAICGESFLFDDLDVYEGLLNDEGTDEKIKSQKISFRILGPESIFSQVETNYASINNGDAFSTVIFTILNQTAITNVFTVSASNISVGTDQTVDDKSSWQNTTVKEVLDDLLLLSNSVLYVKDDVLYVSDRTATAASQYTFYGQSSNNGIENIQNISDIKNGLNKTFNYWTWQNTTLTSQNASSIGQYGVRKKSIGANPITNNTSRTNILNALRDEFSDPKRELELTTPINTSTIALGLLDRITIDYPTVYYTAEGETLPVYELSLYDVAKYPFAEFSLTIETSEQWKIIGRKIDMKGQLITFKLREI